MMPLRQKVKVASALAAFAAMLAGCAALALRGQPWTAAALAAGVLALAALAADAWWIRFDLSGEMLRAGRRDRGEVALTFDDGPGADTPALLDALDASGVKATFFVLGRAAETRPEVVRETARRGHLVALHGHDHRKLHLASPRTVREELDRGIRAVRAAGVEPAPFFRPPHGFKGIVLRRELRRRGLTLAGWTRSVWDTERPGTPVIVERACARMQGGDVILLHDGCGESPAAGGESPAAGRHQTTAAVREIVRRWQGAGFRFVTLDALVPAPPRLERGRAARLLGLAVVVSLGAVALHDLDVREFGRALGEADPALLVVAAAANLAGIVARAARWHALVRPATPGARFGVALRALVMGHAVGVVLPARASDVARVHLHAQATGTSVARLLGTVALDHAMNGATLVAGIGLFALVAPLPAWARSAGIASFVATAAALLAFLAVHRRRSRDAAPAGRLARFLAGLRSGLAAIGDWRALTGSAVAGLLGWGMEFVVALACLAAFDLPPLLTTAVLLVLATTVAGATAISPGNTGAFEVAVVLALAGVGVPGERALAFALGYHAAHLVPVALIGGTWLLASGRGAALREVPLRRSNGSRAPPDPLRPAASRGPARDPR